MSWEGPWAGFLELTFVQYVVHVRRYVYTVVHVYVVHVLPYKRHLSKLDSTAEGDQYFYEKRLCKTKTSLTVIRGKLQ